MSERLTRYFESSKGKTDVNISGVQSKKSKQRNDLLLYVTSSPG